MRIRLDFPLNDIKRDLIKIQERLKKDRPRVLGAIGSRVKDFATRDYLSLSKGGSSAGGAQWKALDEDTFESAARRKTAAKRLVSQRRALASQIRLTKGKGSQAKRAALRQKRAVLMARLRALFATEATKHAVGVDVGVQKVGPRYKVDAQMASVSVGFGRKYSDMFDEERELMPDEPPASWLNTCDEILESWADSIARSELK